MKKVGKEFRKSLSAILAAAMVVSSMPETSLVANAEESETTDAQVYDVGEVGGSVDQTDSYSAVTVNFGAGLDSKFVIDIDAEDPQGNLVKLSDDTYHVVDTTKEVYISVSAKEGYRLLGVESTDGSVCEEVYDGCYKIDDYDSSISLNVTTAAINTFGLAEASKADCTIDVLSNATKKADGTYTVDDNDKDVTFELTLTETAVSAGKAIKSVTYKTPSGTITPDENGVYTVPASAFTDAANAGITVTVNTDSERGITFTSLSGCEVVNLNNVDDNGKIIDNNEDVTFELDAPDNKKVTEVKYYVGTDTTGVDADLDRDGIYTIPSGALTGNVTVKVTEIKDIYKVSFTKDKDVKITSVTAASGDDFELNADDVTYSVTQGSKFAFGITTIEGYTFKVTVPGITNPITPETTGDYNGYYVVPADKLTASTAIKIEKVADTYEITPATGSKAFTLKVNNTAKTGTVKASKKDVVEVVVANATSGKVNKVTVTADSGATNVPVTNNNGKFTFEMPDKDVEVNVVEVNAGATITVDTTGANVKAVRYSTDGTNWAIAGSKFVVPDSDATRLYLKIDPADHYKAKSTDALSCKVNNGPELIKNDNDGKGDYLDIAALGAAKAATVKVATEHKTWNYTFDIGTIIDNNDANTTVIISPENVVEYGDTTPDTKTTSEIKLNKTKKSVVIKVNEGETFKFDVRGYDETRYDATVVVGSTSCDRTDAYYGYSFTADAESKYADANVDITLTATDTTKVVFAEDTTNDSNTISKYYAAIDDNGIVADQKKEITSVATTTGITPHFGQDIPFEIETAKGYKVEKLTIQLIGGAQPKTLAEVENSKSAVIENLPKTVDSEDGYYVQVTVKTCLDESVAQTTKFVVGDAVVTVDGQAVEDNKYVSSGDYTFAVAPKAGYKVTGVSINGVEQKDVSPTGGSFTVEFEKDKDGTPKAGQIVSVVITTEAEANTGAKLIDKDLDLTGLANKDVSVTVSGAVESEDYYVINKDVNEVYVSVALPLGYKLNTYSILKYGQSAINNALLPLNEVKNGVLEGEVSGNKMVYNFKVSTSLLSDIARNANGTVKTDKLSFSVAVDNVTLTTTNATGLIIKDSSDNSVTSPVKRGTKLYLLLDEDYAYYKVYQVVDGEKVPVAVDAEYPTEIVAMDNLKFVTENENQNKDYQVSVSVNDVSQTAPIDGVAKDVTVEGGEKIVITATHTDGDTAANLETFEIDKTLATDCTVTGNTVTLLTSAKDAGKSITFDLITTETVNKKQVKVPITTFTVNISDRAQAVTVDGIEKDATVEIEAGTKKAYAVSFDKATLDSLKETSGMVQFAVDEETGETDYNHVVIDALNVKASDTATKAAIKVDGKSLLEFNVKVVAPKMGIKSATVTSQGTNYANVSIVPESIQRSIEFNNNFAYEVTVTPAATSTLNKVAPTNLATKTSRYYVNYDIKNDVYSTLADGYKIALNAATDLDKSAWDYSVSVKMVLLSDDSTVLASSEAVTFDTATKNAYYEDSIKLAKTKTTTLYTGQTAVVAGVVYSDNASYVDPNSVDVIVYNADKTDTYGWYGCVLPNGDVEVTAPTYAKAGKYIVEVRAEAQNKWSGVDELYASRATVNITVKPGINRIVDTNAPSVLTKNSKKNVSYTFKPVGYSGAIDTNGNAIKATKQKFTYELVTNSIAKGNIGNVTLKNNKLTISKDFELSKNPSNNKVTVRVWAADYTNSDNAVRVSKDFVIEITDEFTELDSIKLTSKNGKAIDLTKTVEYAVFDRAKIDVIDKNGNKATDVKLTSSTGDVIIENGRVYIKEGKHPKSVTIKATTKDGGKKSVSQKIKFGYSAEANLNATLEGGVNMLCTSPDVWTYEGDGGYVKLNVYDGAKNAAADKQTPATREYYNYSIAVKGGKLIDGNNKLTSTFKIQPTAQDMTITITNKAVKPYVKTVITAKDLRFVNEKAPKFKAVKGQKLFTNVLDSQTLEYTVSTDYTAVKINYVSKSSKKCNLGLWNDNNNIAKIEDGKFAFDFYGGTVIGSAKYNLVFGNIVKGQFVPATKPASLTVKNAKVSKFKPVTAYTINYNHDKSVEFVGNPDVIPVGVVSIQNANIAGKANNFTKIFENVPDTNTIQLNSSGIAAYLKANKLTGIDKIPAEDLKGYVVYSYWNGKGFVEETVPVTISLTDTAVNYTVEQAQPCVKVFSNIKAKAYVMNGDKIVQLDKVKAVTSGWALDTDTDADGNTYVVLTSSSAKVGENEVEFKILPDASYQTDIDKYGITVKANIKVEDKDTFAGKVIVDTEKAVVDFNDEDAVVQQSWKDVAKTGTYSMTVDTTEALTSLVNISSMKSNVEGIDVVYNNGSMTVTLTKDKIKGNVTMDLPITVSFEGGALAEEIKYTLVTPKVLKGLGEMKAEITDLIQKTVARPAADYTTDAAALKTAIDKLLTDEAAAGVQAGAVTCTYNDDTKEYKAEVTLTSKVDSTQKEEIAAYLLVPGTKVAAVLKNIGDAEELLKEKANKIVNEDYNFGEMTDAEKAEYLVVNVNTTVFDIRNFLQTALNEAVNGDQYIIQIPVGDYKVVKPQAYTKGSIRFKAYVYAKGNDNESIRFANKTVTTKQLVDETPATP